MILLFCHLSLSESQNHSTEHLIFWARVKKEVCEACGKLHRLLFRLNTKVAASTLRKYSLLFANSKRSKTSVWTLDTGDIGDVAKAASLTPQLLKSKRKQFCNSSMLANVSIR